VKLWTASTISLFGSQVSGLTIPAIAIITLNVSPFEAALLGFFEMLPFILFTLPAGVWVDRLRRRPILIAGDLLFHDLHPFLDRSSGGTSAALKARLTVTVKASERTVRASREGTRKPSSGITPRISGSTQNRVGSSALSAIGKMPQA